MSIAKPKRASLMSKSSSPNDGASLRQSRLFSSLTRASASPMEKRQTDHNQSKDGTDRSRRSKGGPILTWQGADLPRVQPGNYQAVCVGWQGPESYIAYRRWSLRLEFSLLDGGTLVSCFFNFGGKSRPCLQGRQSKFYEAWTLANGELPRKGQDMPLETFSDPSLIYVVCVEDCGANSKQGTKLDALIYSRVTKILKVDRL